MSIIKPRANMMSVIRELGLTQGLKLCLDAGDEASYPGTGQTWSDVSGNGHHFYRGATSGSEGSDPTFNGVAGRRSRDEFFEFDGGDYCSLASGSNPTWVQTFHKAGARLTVAGWVYLTNITDIQGIIGTLLSGGGTGIIFRIASPSVQTVVMNSSNVVLAFGSPSLTNNAWNFFAISLDAAISSRTVIINSVIQTSSANYSSPATGDASGVLNIGSQNTSQPLASGSRISPLMVWDVPLSVGSLMALRQATGGKFGR